MEDFVDDCAAFGGGESFWRLIMGDYGVFADVRVSSFEKPEKEHC